MQNREFRYDINGLRAWAVISVVLFHFGIPGFSGGFVGVDVFFVISGFLMTGILHQSLSATGAQRPFSLVSFYLSRARRIVPALAALCIALVIAGWFFLSPDDYRMLGTHALSAVIFLSNIRFNREAGYFDSASHEKLLLHTWSLSVEWQFYILLPLIMLLVWKLRPGKQTLTATLSALLVASLVFSVVQTSKNPSSAFFLLTSRAWEMLAGGLVYLAAPRITNPRLASILETIGFALIIFSVMFFDATTSWPGSLALFPVAGTVLVLVSARQRSVWTRGRLIQLTGTTSYSVYLWHWPFSAALVYLNMQGQLKAIGVALLLTAVFSWLSWKYVEEPARQLLSARSQPRTTGWLIALVATVIVAGGVVRLNDGLPSRLPEHINSIFEEANNKNPRRDECHVHGGTPVPECTYGGPRLGVIVIGDSHAAAVIRAVEKALPESSLHVLDWTMAACRTIAGIDFYGATPYGCGDFVAQAIQKSHSMESKAPILIVNRLSWTFEGENEETAPYNPKPGERLINEYETRSPEFIEEMTQGVVETACAFAQDRPTYMLRPIPEMKIDVPRFMGRALLLGKNARVSITLDEYSRRHAYAIAAQDRAAQQCGVKILDVRPALCDESRCWGDRNGRPLYYDEDHLSQRGADLLVPVFSTIFQKEAHAGPDKK